MAARGERARQIFTPGRSPLTWFSVRLPSPFPTTWGKRSSNAPKCARCLDAGNHLGRKAPGPETLLPDAAPGTPGPGLLTPGVDLDAGAGRSGCGRWGGGGCVGDRPPGEARAVATGSRSPSLGAPWLAAS